MQVEFHRELTPAERAAWKVGESGRRAKSVFLRRPDGGTDPHDAAQRQALQNLAAAEMVTRGDIIDRFHDNVLYSLRMLAEPPTPTDTNSAPPLP
ncbi:hypothetical protein [Streptomyces subrutilus]|uniref:Uncharacterized protein n=1 Tax=Streptomyces subrutilus TaxID=36818 RepID=A0A1E5P0F7_9ACTN|nr:hypothetical protein [Streptomyces subrutilus]OEJ22481.1 hypothetical protein BGK67_33670 [Streptomyces subrutilus]